jgi:hypothetical protein
VPLGTAVKLETAEAGFFSVFVATTAAREAGGVFVSFAVTVTMRLVSGVRPDTSAEVAVASKCCSATALTPSVTVSVNSERATSFAGMVQATCRDVLVTWDTARPLTALNDRGVAPTATADPIVIELAATITAMVRLAIRDRYLRFKFISTANTPISYLDNM